MQADIQRFVTQAKPQKERQLHGSKSKDAQVITKPGPGTGSTLLSLLHGAPAAGRSADSGRGRQETLERPEQQEHQPLHSSSSNGAAHGIASLLNKTLPQAAAKTKTGPEEKGQLAGRASAHSKRLPLSASSSAHGSSSGMQQGLQPKRQPRQQLHQQSQVLVLGDDAARAAKRARGSAWGGPQAKPPVVGSFNHYDDGQGQWVSVAAFFLVSFYPA